MKIVALIVSSSLMSSVCPLILHSIILDRSFLLPLCTHSRSQLISSHLCDVRDIKSAFFYYLQNDQRKRWERVKLCEYVRSIRFFILSLTFKISRHSTRPLYVALHETHQTDFFMLQLCCKIPCRRIKVNALKHVLWILFFWNLLSHRHAILANTLHKK